MTDGIAAFFSDVSEWPGDLDDLVSPTVGGVKKGDAVALDEMGDAYGDPAAGSVQWITPPVAGQVTLTGYMSINPC